MDYARLTSGIRFELPDDVVLTRWREQIEWLRQAATS